MFFFDEFTYRRGTNPTLFALRIPVPFFSVAVPLGTFNPPAIEYHMRIGFCSILEPTPLNVVGVPLNNNGYCVEICVRAHIGRYHLLTYRRYLQL